MEGSLCRPWCSRCPGLSRPSARCRKVVLVLSVGILLTVVYRRDVSRVTFADKDTHIESDVERNVIYNRESSKKLEKYNIEHIVTFLPQTKSDRLNLKQSTVSENSGNLNVKNDYRTATKEFRGRTGSTVYVDTYQKEKLGSKNIFHKTPSTASSALYPSTTNTSSFTFITKNITTNNSASVITTSVSSVDFATTSSRDVGQHNRGDDTQKTILFYTQFFHGSWKSFLKERTLLTLTCPVSSCHFITNSSRPEEADAVIFHAQDIKMESVPSVRLPNQVYIWLNMEAPQEIEGVRGLLPVKSQRKTQKRIMNDNEEKYGRPKFFNWTFTYHRDSDLLLLYGGLWPLRGKWWTSLAWLLNWLLHFIITLFICKVYELDNHFTWISKHHVKILVYPFSCGYF